MIKSLAIKELRELLGLVALAAVGLGLVAIEVTGMGPGQPMYFPFSSGSHQSGQAMCMGALALLLGFRQTAWELHNGTFYYLLHRPLPRRTVLAVKLAVGALCLVAVNAAFVGIFGWWAATPQTHPTPFFWSMTLPAWNVGLAMLPVYLGAFLSGIRAGRWFGSRLLPAVAGILVTAAAMLLPWLTLGALLALATSAVFVVCIFYYGQVRDY